jgi:hypothetical protein
MEAFTSDPVLASAQLRVLTERLSSFDAALTQGPVALDPFRGQTTIGKTWRDEVLGSRDFEPIRQPLLGFLDRLLERRLNLGVSLEESTRLTLDQLRPRPPFHEVGTRAERRLRALSVAADPERQEEARAAWQAVEADVAALSAVRVLRYERRIEIEGRLGGRLTLPISFAGEADLPNLAGVDPIEELARRVLVETADAARSLGLPGWSGLIHGATGFPALDGWPARLAPEGLLDLVGGRWLLAGSSLGEVNLPMRVCPASFLRGAMQLGRQVFRASTPSSLPFVLCRTPAETYGRTLGRLLALWLLSPTCARRRLGLGAEGRSRHARGAAHLLLCEARVLAARALLAAAGRESRARLDQVWSELGLELCGQSLGPPLGLLSAPPDAEVDLVALLWACSKQTELIQAFDEDFLDNPRARESLLSEIHAVETAHPSYAQLTAAITGVSRRLQTSS